MSTKPNPRDERIVTESQAPVPAGCAAIGCPNVWTVNREGRRCCSAHAYADWREWPLITRMVQQGLLDSACGTGPNPSPPLAPRVIPDGVRERLRNFKPQIAPPREWAHRLREQERHGKKLTQAQRAAWRAVLPEHDAQHWEGADDGNGQP